MLKDYLKIALNAVLKRKLRSYLTMIGVFIGIAAVVSLIGLGEGLREAILGQFGEFSPDTLTVQAGGIQAGPPGTGVITPLTRDDAKELEGIQGVKVIIPRHIRMMAIEFNDQTQFTFAASMVGGDARKEIERVLQIDIEKGRALKDGDRNKVVLGYNFGTEDSGFGKPIEPGQRVIVGGKQFEVVGINSKKGSFIFDNVILMNEAPLIELIDDDETIDIIAVVVNDINEIDAVQERLEKKMRKLRNVDVGEEDFEVSSPQNTLQTIGDTLFAVQLFVYLIASISLLVGGIGIMNTMYTAVLERTKEIGIMKSIGAQNHVIFTIYFIESGFMGLVGGVIGIILGVGLASGLAFVGTLALGSDLISASFSPLLLFGALLFSFLLGSIAGITPALGAAKMNPVDALRYAK